MAARRGQPQDQRPPMQKPTVKTVERRALNRAAGDTRADVRLGLGQRGDPDVSMPSKVVRGSFATPAVPAEVVDQTGGIAALGEAEGELLVEAVEAHAGVGVATAKNTVVALMRKCRRTR